MKTSLLFIALFFYVTYSFSQTTSVPDDNFEAYLEANGMGNGTANDNLVTTANISGVTSLDISSLGISNLTGIEDFTSLINLNCYNNQISTLDFSSNTALEILNCNKNLLTSLNVTNNSALTTLSCGENYVTLTSIDVSQNLNLKILDIQSNNWMTGLNVMNNTALEYLVANGAPITNLDLTQNTALLGLECQYCNLSTLDVSQNMALAGINVGYNYLVDLDLSNNSNLSYIVTIYNNSLVNLNVKNGNNSIISSSFNATHCKSLNCITVDDVAYSTTNWSAGIDAGVIFSTNCALGIEDFDKDTVSVFPNPSKDWIHIALKRDAKYKILNLYGQDLKNGNLLIGNNDLDIQSLSNGLYFLNFETSEGKTTKKIIKE